MGQDYELIASELDITRLEVLAIVPNRRTRESRFVVTEKLANEMRHYIHTDNGYYQLRRFYGFTRSLLHRHGVKLSDALDVRRLRALKLLQAGSTVYEAADTAGLPVSTLYDYCRKIANAPSGS